MVTIEQVGIPLLLFVFIVEFTIAAISNYRSDKVSDMLTNLFLGLANGSAGMFMKSVSFSLYAWVYQLGFLKYQPSMLLWIIAFFACDFIIYLYHLLGHKCRLFWAAHVAHHSSLHYNLSLGLRVNFIHMSYRFLFWSPLCLFGIPPFMILFFDSLTAILNFMIHTERVGKLGFLDLIFNTPSNHRVHHASNKEYLDKNMGGVLMIYDHLFGTYAEEKQKPVYGITHNLTKNHPKEVLLHAYTSLWQDMKTHQGLMNKLKFLFSPPQ
jgi:sterol desaturase/sphingolipid hydroxylase (fatty acid hydroxylase superfamily)